MVPPWWTPYAFGGLLIAAIATVLLQQQAMPRWPVSAVGWIASAGFVTLGLYASNLTLIALEASKTPTEHIVDFSSPLGPGTYLVANGGSAPSVNAHAAFLDQRVAEHKPYWGTGHGIDVVAIDRWGLRADGLLPADPRRYLIFGRPVVAPCAGDVMIAVDGLPDMLVPRVDKVHLAGNHVILRCSGVDILLGHFGNGTVVVRRGQQLATGDTIAAVGNSGNTSEPHLHIHAQLPGTADAPFSGAPIPIRIDGRYLRCAHSRLSRMGVEHGDAHAHLHHAGTSEDQAGGVLLHAGRQRRQGCNCPDGGTLRALLAAAARLDRY
jgi:hypothetical protein